MEVNAQAVIAALLEQNKQLTLEIAVLKAHLGLVDQDNEAQTEVESAE